ncbi:FAD dependent oxidoreductase [Chytridium lagenaria]|nr:FAD dependent oxidoreductase [Chytridium lagenaria]
MMSLPHFRTQRVMRFLKKSLHERLRTHASIASSTISQHFDVVICGGGLLGASTAYHLVENAKGPLKVLIVEKDDPLMLTSSKSTVRNFYPQFESMTRLANRSIDIIADLSKESGNAFGFQRKGYVFLSAHKEKMQSYAEMAKSAEENGSGSVRFHGSMANFRKDKYMTSGDGIDLIDDPEIIKELVPGCTPDVQVMMHVRKAGYLDVFQLGKLVIEKAMSKGVTIVKGVVEDVDWRKNSDSQVVDSVRIRYPDSQTLSKVKTDAFVIASGPYLREIGDKCGVNFPVINELHARVAITDPMGIVPSESAFTIWSDNIDLPFSDAERNAVEKAHRENPSLGYDKLLKTIEVPGIAGAHARPVLPTENGGVRQFFGIWTYENDDIIDAAVPPFPPPIPPLYGAIILRGLSRMYPGLKSYFPTSHTSFLSTSRGATLNVESGYYCKTEDNTPLLGRVAKTDGGVKVHGMYSCAGVSGFGVMCSQSAGEGVAVQVLEYLGKGEGRWKGEAHPSAAFEPGRFEGRGSADVKGGKLRTANQL